MNSFQLSCFHKNYFSIRINWIVLTTFFQMAQTSSIFQICLDHTIGLHLVVYSDDSYEQVDRLFQCEVDMKSHLLYCMHKHDVMESPHSVKNEEIQLYLLLIQSKLYMYDRYIMLYNLLKKQQ